MSFFLSVTLALASAGRHVRGHDNCDAQAHSSETAWLAEADDHISLLQSHVHMWSGSARAFGSGLRSRAQSDSLDGPVDMDGSQMAQATSDSELAAVELSPPQSDAGKLVHEPAAQDAKKEEKKAKDDEGDDEGGAADGRKSEEQDEEEDGKEESQGDDEKGEAVAKEEDSEEEQDSDSTEVDEDRVQYRRFERGQRDTLLDDGLPVMELVVAPTQLPGIAVGSGLVVGLSVVALFAWICVGDSMSTSAVTEEATRNSHGLLSLQLSNLFGAVLFMSAFAALIPESYNLASDLGFGACASGLLIGGCPALQGVACIGGKVLVQEYSGFFGKVVITASDWVYLLCLLVFALAADPPEILQRVTATQRFACLMACRLLMGICVGVGFGSRSILAIRSTPNSQMVRYQLCRMCALTVGIGLGPLLSAIAVHSSGTVEVSKRAAIASDVFVFPWLVFTVASMMLTPSDTGFLLVAKAAADAALDATEGKHALSSPGHAVSAVHTETRRAVWVKCLVYGAERAFIVSALEAATAFVLEREFGWSTDSIGIAIGATFIVSLPLTALVEGARLWGWLSDLRLLSMSACVCALSSILFFPKLGGLMGLPEHANVGLILIADCLIFSSGYLANGVIDGLGVKSSSLDSAYTTENYIVVAELVQSFARFIGPPFARAVLSERGRSVYASCQLCISTIGCVTCLSVASAMRDRK